MVAGTNLQQSTTYEKEAPVKKQGESGDEIMADSPKGISGTGSKTGLVSHKEVTDPAQDNPIMEMLTDNSVDYAS